MDKRELYLIRGVPGAGKTTLAKSLGGKHVEADMFYINKDGVYNWKPEKVKEAHSWCQNQVGEWMVNGEEKIVVSNTFTQEWEMQWYYDWANKFDYKVFSLIVNTALDILIYQTQHLTF